MKPFAHRAAYLALIGLLLFGQQGLMVHAAEHPFHLDDSLCDVFLANEQSADAAVVAINLAADPAPSVPHHSPACSPRASTLGAFHARAPPAIL